MNKKLHPYFVTGFCDAESYFHISITKNPKYKAGWQIKFVFGIALHKKDQKFLELIQFSLGEIGGITKQGENKIQYRVWSIKELGLILSHFDKYPLITQNEWIINYLNRPIFYSLTLST